MPLFKNWSERNFSVKYLSNQLLVSHLKSLVSEELNLTIQILNYLREVEIRGIFADMGYSSLFEFCLKELKYSEGSTQRRISAMRLLKDLPEVEPKVRSGEISLSVASQAQSFFKKQERKSEAYSKEAKLELLKDLENTTRRECERILLKKDPEFVLRDYERPITEELTEIRLTVDQEFMKKLEDIKNLLSHAQPYATTKTALEVALEFFLAKKDPLRSLPPKAESSPSPPPVAVKHSRFIGAKNKRAVWKKAKGRCCFRDPTTGRQCEARRFLEIDHIQAYSNGGTNDVSNLQLLCSIHNALKSNS